MILRRCAPEPDRLGPLGRSSVSLGAGEPASDSLDEVRDRWIDCLFLGAGLCVAESDDCGRSEEGAGGLGGRASELRLEPEASEGVVAVNGVGVGPGGRACTGTSFIVKAAGLSTLASDLAATGFAPLDGLENKH